MTITITEQHLDEAIAAVQESQWAVNNCLLAQAAGGPTVVAAVSASSIAYLDLSKLKFPEEMCQQIYERTSRFDSAFSNIRYCAASERAAIVAELRTMLPITVQGELQPSPYQPHDRHDQA